MRQSPPLPTSHTTAALIPGCSPSPDLRATTVPCYGDQLTATTAENVLIGWTLWQLPKVDCSPPGCFISTCIKTCLHLRFYTRASVDQWESRTRSSNQGSTAVVTLPAFLLTQTSIRREAWEVGGEGCGEEVEDRRRKIGVSWSCWINFIRKISNQVGPVLTAHQWWRSNSQHDCKPFRKCKF